MQFSQAASQLISSYVPQSALVVLGADVQIAASSAHVSYDDPQSLLYSCLMASSPPSWFTSAIPSAYSTQIAALESDISTLRGTVSAVAPGQTIAPVVVPVTATISTGQTVVLSLLSSPPAITSVSTPAVLSSASSVASAASSGAPAVLSTVRA